MLKTLSVFGDIKTLSGEMLMPLRQSGDKFLLAWWWRNKYSEIQLKQQLAPLLAVSH